MTALLTNLQKAQAIAAERSAESLAHVDLAARCAQLGLPALSSDGALAFRIFGQDLRLLPPTFQIETRKPKTENPSPARLVDRILVLHYLLCDASIHPTGDWISFCDLPGGAFYFGPFSARTTRPLVQRIGNDLDQLHRNLTRLDHQLLPALAPTSLDLAARIHIIGPLHLALLYHAGDDEAPASAALLFDSCIKRAFTTEDVAVLSSRICLGLL